MRSGIFKLERIASAILFLSVANITSIAQEIPDKIVATIEDYSDELSDNEIELLIERIEYYYSHPIPINACKRDALESLGLLNTFQIESIMDYRDEYGDILSAGELALIDGFNVKIATMIADFIDFSSEYAIGDVVKKRMFKTEIVAKGKKKWAKDGIGLSSKIISTYGSHSAGIIVDNDAGEKFPDFTSAYYQYEGRNAKIVAGNYTARFGQGLVLWKSFPVNFASSPSTVAKKGNGLSGYTSLDEDNYLRGIAVSLNTNKGNLSIITSAKPIDARIKDGKYTSVVTGGLHVTDAEMAKRHTMNEYLAAANYTYETKHTKVGFTLDLYGYDKPNGRRVSDYNSYQMYDGLWGNAGMDIYCFINRFRIFGEVAMDAHFAPAVIVGSVWSPYYELEMSLTFRYYDKAYIATHSGAYSTQSSVSNQLGTNYALRYNMTSHSTLNLSTEGTYFPWARFNISKPSYLVKARLLYEYDNEDKLKLSFRSNYSLKGQIGETPVSTYNIKATMAYTLSNRLSMESSAVLNRKGYTAFLGFTFNAINKKLKVSSGVTRYDIADWNSRISLYEKGMPQTYSVETFYGTGWSGYCVLKYAPTYKTDFYIKVSDRYIAFLTRICIPG